MWEKDNKGKIEIIKEKLEDRKDLCNVKWPICIYDASLKYQYNDTVIYRELNDCNIIEDYFEDDKYLKGKKYYNYKEEIAYSELDFDSILIERKSHYCFEYHKNISFDIESDSKDNSGLITSEDEMKNDKEINNENNDYLAKKRAYKKIRKMSNFCSYLYYKNSKIKNNNNKDKKENNIEKFFTKELLNYSKYSFHNISLAQLPKNFLSKNND